MMEWMFRCSHMLKTYRLQLHLSTAFYHIRVLFLSMTVAVCTELRKLLKYFGHIQGDQKVSVHLTVTVQQKKNTQKYSILNSFNHRIHSECGPCYNEHGLREHSSACQ